MADISMTQEGDRSGTTTPSRREKARLKLRALAQKLLEADAHWDTVTVGQVDALRASAQVDLVTIVLLMEDKVG